MEGKGNGESSVKWRKNMVNQSVGQHSYIFAGGDLEGNSVNPPENMVDVGDETI